MASEPEIAGIGAVLKPDSSQWLKFVDLHPRGAAALSGKVANVSAGTRPRFGADIRLILFADFRKR